MLRETALVFSGSHNDGIDPIWCLSLMPPRPLTWGQVRKRRDDAEAEREEMERLKAEEARLREQQQYGDWQKKEEHFHLKQATQRSKVCVLCVCDGVWV